MENQLNCIIRRRDNNGLDRNLIRRVILNDIFAIANPHNADVERNFNLNNLEARVVKQFFRFEREDIVRLVRALRIPEIIRTRSGFAATGTEGLCILLRRLAYPNRLCELEGLFRRSSSALSEISNFMSAYICEHFGRLLEDLGHLQWLDRPKLAYYSEAIYAKGAALQNCWSFIDGTARGICRPSEEQQDYYSGHKRFHCVKYQSVLTPDDIIVSLLGAYPGRRHDAFVFRESGLYRQLEERTGFNDDHFVVYGDQAYGIRELLLCPYPGQGLNEAQQNFNRSMSLVRQAVEWGFQKVIAEFAFVDFKKNQKLLLQDIQTMYKTAVILTNCHTCLYSSQTAQYFNIRPITLEQYLN